MRRSRRGGHGVGISDLVIPPKLLMCRVGGTGNVVDETDTMLQHELPVVKIFSLVVAARVLFRAARAS